MHLKFMLFITWLSVWLGGLSQAEISFAATASSTPSRVTVSAAISLKDALQKVQQNFQLLHPEIVLRFNFAGSGQLKNQILEGAPVDVFISASERDSEDLFAKGRLVPNSRVLVAKNRLVFIVPKSTPSDSIHSVQELNSLDFSKIALGQANLVPAGRYAQQALQAAGQWEKLKKQIIPCENVRQVLDYVARGEVDGGFVYASDLRAEARVRPVFIVPDSLHEPIQYPGALVKNSSSLSAAKAFLDYLQLSESQSILEASGFLRGTVSR